MRSEWVWMPHPGHMYISQDCKFFLTTWINGYIVSTVGEYRPDSRIRDTWTKTQKRKYEKMGSEDIGNGRLYQTRVFKSLPKDEASCCFYRIMNSSELDDSGYVSAKDAYLGHIRMCEKWDTRSQSTVIWENCSKKEIYPPEITIEFDPKEWTNSSSSEESPESAIGIV